MWPMVCDSGKDAGEGNRMLRRRQKNGLRLMMCLENNNEKKMTYVQLTWSSTATPWASTASVKTAPAAGPLSIWRRCSSLSSSPFYFRYLQNYYTIPYYIWTYLISICRALSNPRCSTGSLPFATYGITSNPTIPTKCNIVPARLSLAYDCWSWEKKMFESGIENII